MSFGALLALAPASVGGVLEDIGFATLNARTGTEALRARGAGVAVGLVEDAPPDDIFRFSPDVDHPALAGKTYTYLPTQGSVSPHATRTSNWFFGLDGVAPAVGNVTVFLNDYFVTGSALNGGSLIPPSRLGLGVINNSWIGTTHDEDQDQEIVRRLDYMIRRDNVVVVNAVDNVRNRDQDDFPTLMAGSYNGITVGAATGGVATGSVGPIKFDDEHGERAKPDLVVPVETTSEAAAVVSGSAALLISEARARGMKTNPLAVKSVMMATADRLRGWNKGQPGKSDDKKVPLDYELGAGLLRVDRAFDVMVSGRPSKRGNIPLQGWDSRQSARNKPVEYVINLPSGASEFDAVLTWNRQIEVDYPFDDADTEMADMDLLLYQKVTRQVAGRKGRTVTRAAWKLITRSLSKADNVETFFLRNLAAGTYKITVRSDEKDYFGLAWDADLFAAPMSEAVAPVGRGSIDARRRLADVRFTGSAGAVPEPGGAALLLGAGALFARRSRRRGD